MIRLYMRNDCPFCNKVKKAVKNMGLREEKEYEIIDATQGTPGRETVLQIGGKGMVPFLIDGEHNMYESDDIIEYIRNKFST